eukprot:5661357-Pleurochrysis_carterae.AAC.1
MAANGAAYRTRTAQYYPAGMNRALADSILGLLPTTAAVLRDAKGESRIDDEEDMLNLFDTSDADITEAYGLKVHRDDNPTWAQAMRSDEANQWRDAARAEMQNFELHGVYVEISEDQLQTWNSTSKRASELERSSVEISTSAKRSRQAPSTPSKHLPQRNDRQHSNCCARWVALQSSELDSLTLRPPTCRARSKETTWKFSYDHRLTNVSSTIEES